MNESKNLVAALRLQNEELISKNEEHKREIKQWEVMYKEWMNTMEARVNNINRTHQILQNCITPNQQADQQQQADDQEQTKN